MAAKKKSKKVTKSKRTSPKKAAKSAPKRKAPKKATAKKLTAKKPTAKKSGKKLTAKKKPATVSRKKTTTKAAARRAPRKKAQVVAVFDQEVLESDTIEESGDLQGLSGQERADSESVEELVEEGNAFEAGIVAGVEAAEDDAEREVHTRDVPEEYQEEDQ